MIWPVCVNHSDFCNCRITVFWFKIILAKCYIVGIHRKTVFTDKRFKTTAIKRNKTVECFNFCRNIVFYTECLRFFKNGFSRLYRVDYVFFYICKLFFCYISVKNINLSGADKRSVALWNNLDTLWRWISPLIKLSRKIFYCKCCGSARIQVFRYYVKLRLWKNCLFCIIEKFLWYIFSVIAIDNSDIG